MEIIRKNGITVYLDPDEEWMDYFDAVARAPIKGFLANSARKPSVNPNHTESDGEVLAKHGLDVADNVYQPQEDKK
jgi:hypothetical protein